MFKVTNKNRTMLSLKIFHSVTSGSIVDFEKVNVSWVLLTL